MNWQRQKRQILLFVGPILIPAIVLIGQAIRMYRADAEIAQKRQVEQRRDDFDRLRRQLADRLEAIKLQEIDRRLRPQGSADTPPVGDSAVVLVTPIIDGHVVLPWKAAARDVDRGESFATNLSSGEAEEFIARDFAAAAERYRQTLPFAHTTTDECDARLHLGRALVKARQMDEARAAYEAIVQRCGDTPDEDGIPYRFYAIECLVKARLESSSDRQIAIVEANSPAWRPPLQLYQLKSLLESMAGAAASPVPASLSAKIQKTEQIGALAEDISRIQIRLEPSSPDRTKPSESVWLAYGDEPWLITTTPPSRPLPSLIFAVSSRSVSPPDVHLTTTAASGSELLGENFPGLRVAWPQNSPGPGAAGLPTSLYIAGVALILSITVLGGYLLLRNIDRDLRLAEMRSHFVASVSHELKTPLTVIRMYAEMLVLGQVPDRNTTAEYHQTIVNESERLSQLVDNVLDFSKIERDSRNYVMRQTMLADVVKTVVHTMQHPLTQEGFDLNVRIDETLPSISADPLALEQAILNLLTNAMKYSGGSRRIDLLVKRTDGEAAIEVRDWGIGIAKEDQMRVFERFYRVRSADTESIAGTGLGLTLVAHIVQAHGGRIAVNSAPGQGSTFAIRIPLSGAEAFT